MKIALLLVGFVILIKGADLFVDGASAVARKLKVPPLISLVLTIPGLTVFTRIFWGANSIDQNFIAEFTAAIELLISVKHYSKLFS